MCGIVGYIGSQDCADILLRGLERLEYRGYDSAGLAIFDGRQTQVARSVGKLVNLGARMKAAPIPEEPVSLSFDEFLDLNFFFAIFRRVLNFSSFIKFMQPYFQLFEDQQQLAG